MPSDSTETTQPMTVEDAAALEGAPKVVARPGVKPWMLAVSIAGLLAGAVAGYWLKKP